MASAAPLNISRGVSAGLLLTPLRPIYPEIARIAHVSGTVVVTATIDKNGRIIGLQVLSGPVMLQQAAVAAVRDARYRPYLLNGQPVEVITTFSVNFVMG
jgi:protein TonB